MSLRTPHQVHYPEFISYPLKGSTKLIRWHLPVTATLLFEWHSQLWVYSWHVTPESFVYWNKCQIRYSMLPFYYPILLQCCVGLFCDIDLTWDFSAFSLIFEHMTEEQIFSWFNRNIIVEWEKSKSIYLPSINLKAIYIIFHWRTAYILIDKEVDLPIHTWEERFRKRDHVRAETWSLYATNF